jgi:hypothetical protein
MSSVEQAWAIEALFPHDPHWQSLCDKLRASSTLAALVLCAWQMGLWVAKVLVEHQLNVRSQASIPFGNCPVCGMSLVSKGFVPRQLLTLIGVVRWKRRVSRCPNRCSGSQKAPFDAMLGIVPDQQTSIELVRLGCILAVFLPFELAASVLQQLSGIAVSDATLWNWVQVIGTQAHNQIETQLQNFENGNVIESEVLDPNLSRMPLIIAADGVTVPFRSQENTPKGKIVWREIKVALLTRLGQHQTTSGKTTTRLHQRRLVAVLGDIDALKPRLQLEAVRQGVNTATQIAWLSDGARGFWRLYQECFAPKGAIGILDFYHAAQHLWKAASAYQDSNPTRTPQQWFESLRHRLRHGFINPLIRELHCLSHYRSTAASARSVLQQVRDYFKFHVDHVQYRSFKKMELPVGSGMVESACKWLIQQRFKGVGMRWSQPGFNHLLYLRLAWVNQRFDPLFSQEPLSLVLYFPNY